MNKKIIISIPCIDNLLYLAIFLMIVKTICSFSAMIPYPDWLDNCIVFSSLGIFMLQILKKKYTPYLFICYAIISLLVLYGSLKIGSFNLVISAMTCLALRDENLDDVLKFIFKYGLIFVLFHVFISILGFFLWDVKIIDLSVASELCFNFGFNHRNTFSVLVTNLIFLWIYLNFKRINIHHIMWLMVTILLLYFVTKTKTSLILLLSMLFVYMMIKHKDVKDFHILTMFIIPVLFLLMGFFVYLFIKDYSLAYKIDDFLTYRVRLGAYGVENWGLTLFGQKIPDVISWDAKYRLNNFTYDNIYTFFMSNQGIIYGVIISILFFFLARRKDKRVNFMILSWALYGITEVYGLNIYMFFPMILLTNLLNKKSEIYQTSESRGGFKI